MSSAYVSHANATASAAACQIGSNQSRNGAFSRHTSSSPASTAQPRSTGGEEPAPRPKEAKTALPAHGPLAQLFRAFLKKELLKAERNDAHPS